MKHKPMLFDKLASKNHGNRREVIGLIGTHHGVGVTHTALMLAIYMGEELGKKTALLECNNHHDMSLIQNAYQWSFEDAFSFSFHQVTCYKEITPNRIAELFGEDYECLIFDFGIDLKTNREEFMRCGTKIVIGGRSEWDRQKLIRFIESTETIKGSDNWLYFVPQLYDKTVTKIKSELERKVWRVPAIKDPTITTYHSNRFFGALFRS